MSQITERDVEYIAGLAHLALDDASKQRLTRELGEILGYVAKLNELDTENVEPMMHALAMSNVFREDEVGPSLPHDTALRTAPAHDGNYFIVPRILDTDEV